MAPIIENLSLKPYNTFGIDVKSRFFCNYKTPADLIAIMKNGPLWRDTPMLILGGGSNQLFTKNFEGVIIHPINDAIERLNETSEDIYIKAGAGLEWDQLVAYAVDHNWGGIENLSNIPGNVGAAPVQNIGAYGVEAKDTIYEVHLVSLNDGSTQTIKNEDCAFAYRDSIFKHRLKNQYLIDSVTFKLAKKPKFNVEYGSITDEIKALGEVNLQNIRKAIINIRNSKLPDPKLTGNAGSFFKNPVIPEDEANRLLQDYPNMPVYPSELGSKKLAAGWLIEQCGLKGYINSQGTAGVHSKQALVIVNLNRATGIEIIEVARFVQAKVFEKFDICLEPEVIFV